jgi:hypothetical protein
MSKIRKTIGAATATFLATGLSMIGAVLVGSAGVAHAQITPPWETSGPGGGPVDANEVGSLIFLDSSGNQITSGSLSSSPFGSFVEGTTILNANDKKATLFAFTPVLGQPPGTWNNDQLSASTIYPVSSPASLASSSLPVVSSPTSNLSFTDYEGEFPNTDTSTTDGYGGVYQLRLFSSDPTGTQTYDSADILISGSGSSATWSEEWPTSFPTTTTTSLTASPAGSAGLGVTVSLTAKVSSGVAGENVVFEYVTSTNVVHVIGTAQTDSTGTAVTSTSTLPIGTYTLLATFAGNNTYSGSTGTITGYQVTAATTSTSLTASPASPTALGTPVTLTATVTSSGNPVADGQVQFKDGSTLLGSPVVLSSSGTATLTAPSTGISALPIGTDALSATFTDTADTNYMTSTGNLNYSVTAIPTSTTLTESPASPQPFGTSVTLTATVTSGVAGTVQFSVGSTNLGGPVTVSGGVASFTTSALPGGTDSLKAVFTPTSSSYASSNDTGNYTISAVSTTNTLTASPPSPQGFGTSVTLKATISPAAATGTVQFSVGSTNLGGPVAVSGGVATFATTALPEGTDTLQAVFTPANSNDYMGSTGNAPFTVITPTTTSLTVSPPSPQPYGTSETLTATVTSGVAGSVQFLLGSTDLGGPITVSGGTATYTTSTLPAGSDALKAVFTPTSSLDASSTGTATFVVQAIPTSTTLTASPASPQLFGTSETLTATVTSGVAGSVQFSVGSTDLGGPVTVSGGTATYATSTLPVGPDSLKAVFTPTSSTDAASTGTALFVVQAIPTSTSLTVSPASPQKSGTSITFTATVTSGGAGPAGAASLSPAVAGSVQFWVGTDKLGSPVKVSGGVAKYTTTALPVGSDSLKAVFVPVSGSGYGQSSANVSYTIVQSGHTGKGYWLIQSNGAVVNMGDAGPHGSLGGVHLDAPVIGSAATPDDGGYWLVASDGGVFNLGDAGFFGSLGDVHLNAPIVAIATTPNGKGYWLVGSDGGVFTFGDAGFHGSLGDDHLDAPIVGIVATPSGNGYWLVAKDGGVFTFGDAGFHGSLGDVHLDAPIVAIVATPSGNGYWLVAKDGGVFTFGDAGFHGSLGDVHLSAPIVAIVATPSGNGYWLVGSDGGVFSFGDAGFYGSEGGAHSNAAIVGISEA